MKSINLEINQSNMISIFSSKDFYGSWKVFFRELLQNAYDACFTRQALEWSWGTEFLEMETVKQVNSVREPYVPKIVINYDSSAHLLSIVDNGIGMNEHDLEEYLAKLGESFYVSKEFTEQKLAYEPISRFGIGMCSCFMVARAILIESKKDRAINTAWNIMNRQQLDAVMVKWFGDGRQIEYVPCKRKESGTKITLPLKPAAEKRMNMDFIIETINHFLLYPVIPITVVCDGERRNLYQSKMVWKMPFVDVLGVTTIQIDNEALEGYLVIYNSKYKSMFGDSELWQQNFRVVENVDTLDLKPHWIKNMDFHLHLKKRLLNLTMSKNEVVRDDNWRKLREEIGNILVRHYNKAPVTLAQYIMDGKERLLSEFKAESDLVERAIQVQVYIKEQEVEVPVRTVIHGFFGKTMKVAIISKNLFVFYRDNFSHAFNDFKNKYDVIIFEKNSQAFMQFVSPYIVSTDYIIGDTPGIIYTEVMADLREKRDVSEYGDKYILYPQSCGGAEVFCLVDNTRIAPFELVINPENRNAKLLEQAAVYPKVSRLRAVIMENIKRRITGTQKYWDKLIDFGGLYVDEWNSSKAVSIESCWSLEESFPKSLNEFISTQLTEAEMKQYKLMDLKFTREDFISWWYPPR